MPWKDAATRREYHRRHRASGYLTPQNRHRREVVAELFQVQNGRCYLCGDTLALGGRSHKSAVLEHDHRCCPAGSFCRYCLRGLACADCNTVIGYAREDPARLRTIAGNFEAVLPIVAARLAAKPQQMSLTESPSGSR